MADEFKRVKKQIEVDVVELNIELSAEFFDNMMKAKKQVADKRGYDITIGEYIEEAMNDLVKMVDDYSYKLQQASELIKKQDAMLLLIRLKIQVILSLMALSRAGSWLMVS